GEKLHIPTTSVVTPWRTLDSADGQPSYTRSECEWMSMKPGATMRPCASTLRAASRERFWPTETMRSFSMATSAVIAGAPLPSTTVPFLISSDQLMTVGPPGLERSYARRRRGRRGPFDYDSTIFTDFILSPFLILSTTSMPDVTLPKTVYLPSRKLAGA